MLCVCVDQPCVVCLCGSAQCCVNVWTNPVLCACVDQSSLGCLCHGACHYTWFAHDILELFSLHSRLSL